MGVRKIDGNIDGSCSYMYTNTSIANEILIVLLRGNTGFSVKLETNCDAVKKWCNNLQKSPEAYMSLLHKAVESCSVTYSNSNDEDKNEDVFEIQENCLVWKQFFPDKKVYGRRGKFTLDTINLQDAVNEILNGAVKDLDHKSSIIQQLTNDLAKESKEVQRAKDLAARSVQEKESFEKEIYGKCASIINAKKLRIKHLMSSQPSTSESQSPVVRKIVTSSEPVSQSSKPSKSNCDDSDGYSSDTDVDNPEEDIDTDEENLQRITTQKRKKASKRVIPIKQFNDSQDSLFNDSLEAELYSTDFVNKKPKVSTEKPSKRKNEKVSTGETNTCSSVPQVSSTSDIGDMQRSILDEFL